MIVGASCLGTVWSQAHRECGNEEDFKFMYLGVLIVVSSRILSRNHFKLSDGSTESRNEGICLESAMLSHSIPGI